MLKSQLLNFAMKTVSRAYMARSIIKEQLENKTVKSYVESIKEAALFAIEQKLKSQKKYEAEKKSQKKTSHTKEAKSAEKKTTRKSSIKPLKEIKSANAELILKALSKSPFKAVNINDEIHGKKTLAYLVWSLGMAKHCNLSQGMSTHDVCSLLYQTQKIEVYPINMSRLIHKNTHLFTQSGQISRTKTYILTKDGEKMFNEHYSN